MLVMLLWSQPRMTCALDRLTGTTDVDYQPDPVALEALRHIAQPVEIVLVYGSGAPTANVKCRVSCASSSWQTTPASP